MRMVIGGLILLSAAGPVVAENGPAKALDASTGEIRGLTDREIADLRAGLGMGRARAAELNGYPGPRHVLDAAQAGQLALTVEQTRTAQRIWDDMAREARRLGDLVLQEERDLEAQFRAGRIGEADLRARAMRIAALDGELRAVHLRAHLEMRGALSEEQVARYNQLRGYAGGQPAEHRHSPRP